MSRNLLRYTTVSFIMLFFILTSCREDIVQPQEFATNVNEPVESKYWNSYTFLLNAENLSIDVTNNPQISSLTTRITISIIDYSSGYIHISLLDPDLVSRFNYLGNEEERHFSEVIEGFLPRLGIRTFNFTGKVKVQLSLTY